MVPQGSNYTDSVALDVSIGRDTRLVFTYYNDIDVYVDAPSGNTVTMYRDSDFKLISVRISGIVVSLRIKIAFSAFIFGGVIRSIAFFTGPLGLFVLT